MANITIGGNAIHTNGTIPQAGSNAPEFSLVAADLSRKTLNDYKGSRLILNIYPSVDTGVCATSVRKFNEMASSLKNTKVLCISRDLPFAQKRFCGAEGIENVEMLSDFVDGNFGKAYQLEIQDGAFANLHSRCIVVVDENGKVLYSEQVPEIGQETNYDAALAAL